MSKKNKGVVRFGVGVYEDAKARSRHQDLIMDYEELLRRKLILAAEVRKEAVVATNMTLLLDKNQKERMLCANDAALRNFPTAAFDLNQDCGPSGKEASLPIRAPKFDLNKISVGDEDFQINVEAVKFEEAKKSLIRGIIYEQQNDLKLVVCRNSGEGSSRAGSVKSHGRIQLH
ncbi:hypothetical protein DH2020_045274 [Rehmannia glutinosa]|uniref:Uncharacterized protein n=1 Tax=Rehmannia glutinosa TaxID=99300 RepID=A0ABR0UGA3_REHGL